MGGSGGPRVDLELATVLGSEEFWDRLLGNSSKPIGIAGPMRKGGTLIKLPRDFLRGMYQTFPKAKDPRTGAPVDVCLRSLCRPVLGPDKKPCCKTACSTDPKHPLHRPGENQCNRYHPPLQNPGLLTELQPGHVALGLVHGGFRCYPRAPSDPMELQAEAMRLKAAQENNASLAPVTWLGSEQLWRRRAMRVRGMSTLARTQDVSTWWCQTGAWRRQYRWRLGFTRLASSASLAWPANMS